MNVIFSLVEEANSILWGAPMLAALVFSGGYFTLRTGGMQFRRWLFCLRATVFSKSSRNSSGSGVTPFQAMASSLAATLGTGNIAGVAAALTSGGAGAVFWMWVTALLGTMTGYAENVLGGYYRRKNGGEWHGGAMYYIRYGLAERKRTSRAAKPLAAVFAGACVLASFGMGNIVQMNSAALALESGFGVPAWIAGLALTVCAGAVIFGGMKRTAKVSEKLVPLMSGLYIIGSLMIIAVNFRRLPEVMGEIFRGAFGLEQAAAGVSGYMVKQAAGMGIRRGVFSNEAGLGSSPSAHASSEEAEPCILGMWSIVEITFNTLIMCSMTALVLLCCPCRAAPMDEVFQNITAQPQYFRLTEQEGLVTPGAEILVSGGGELREFRTADGGTFSAPVKSGGITCANIMKITGVGQGGEISGVVIEEVSGSELVTAAFSSVFGGMAGKLISAAVVMFAFTTVIGWSCFGRGAAEYLFGKGSRVPYLVVFTAVSSVGGMLDVSAAWGAADLFNGVMAAVNLPVVLLLSGKVVQITRNFSARRFHGSREEAMISAHGALSAEEPPD
ncbi:amino acid carrier protein [Eubacterium sp. CAG:115]|nr:amino acid carrier protein [Eubacterium sp. CAG:115]